MRIQRLFALVFLPALLGACKPSAEPDDPTEISSSSGDDTGPTTTAAGCDPDACSAMCADNHDEPCHTPYAGSCEDDLCVCEKQPDDCAEPMVECGEVTCSAGQICVQPGLACDHDMDPPEFFTPPPLCADPPSACVEGSDGEEAACLGAEFCEGDGLSGEPTYADGQLTCPPAALDCF